MAQTVRTLETGIATPELGPEAHSLPCEVVGSDEEFSNEICTPGLAKWTPKDKKPSRGACETPSQKRGDWQRNANKKEEVCSLLRLWIWIQIIPVFFYLSLPRIGEADNPGPV